MVGGDPIGVVGGSGGNGRAWTILSSLDTLSPRSTLLARLARLALLGEVRSNPNGVEEVNNAKEGSQEEDVKEDTIEPR